MNLVSCCRCQAQVPIVDTTFDMQGNYMCHRCTSVADLANTVERAQQSAIAQANSRSRGWGWLGRWIAVRQAKREHAAFVASLPDVDKAPTRCNGCGAEVARGYSLCEGCRPSGR